MEVYGEGWLSEPVLWWLDIFMIDAAVEAEEERQRERKDGPRLPAARDFEDLARGE